MKISSILLFVLFFSRLNAQQNSIDTIEMLFPGGKSKALILSYDDGRIQDRQLVQLMNKYNLVGTFHLNSFKLGTDDYLKKDEIKKLFQGHEVSAHSCNHPNLTSLTETEIVFEVYEDRKELERLVDYTIRGMAYPFGNNNDTVVDIIHDLGIEYARTVDDTYNFEIPKDFLKWHPTIHQFAKAYWEPNNPTKDSLELSIFNKTIDDFLSTEKLALLDVWGHSWEMGSDQQRWDDTELFFKKVAKNAQVHYTSHIDLVDYFKAFNMLKFSADKKIVYNLSSSKLFFKVNGNTYSVSPGKTITI